MGCRERKAKGQKGREERQSKKEGERYRKKKKFVPGERVGRLLPELPGA